MSVAEELLVGLIAGGFLVHHPELAFIKEPKFPE